MRGQESEAYEIDALARQRLAGLGFEDAGRGMFYRHGQSDIRVVVTQGEARHGIVSYGRCVVEKRFQGEWVETDSVSKSDFAYNNTDLELPPRNPPALGIKPPNPS